MAIRKQACTFLGNPLDIHGEALTVGQTAPDFSLVANDLSARTLADFAGKTKIIMMVPSLDTGVCDMGTRRFNAEATSLGDDVVVLVVSMDLPFAQARWCGAAGVENVVTLSDYQTAKFGQDYGVLIDGLRLLARAVVVLDKDNKVTYTEYLKEITEQVNFDGALNAVKALKA